jgi:hypothetical protein
MDYLWHVLLTLLTKNEISFTNKYTTTISIAIAIPPHNGAVIHHHDHVITLVSLRTRNTMNNNPKKVIPPLSVLEF